MLRATQDHLDEVEIQGAWCQRRGEWQPLSGKRQRMGKDKDIPRLSQGRAVLSSFLKGQVLFEVGSGALTGSGWVSASGWK